MVRVALVMLLLGAAAGVGVWRLAHRLRATEPADGTADETGETSVSSRGEGVAAVPPAGVAEVAGPLPAGATDAGVIGVQAQDAATAATNPSGASVATLLAEIQSAGAPTDDDTRRSGERAAFARAAALDEVKKAAVEAAVDRFISAAEEVGANVAASATAVPPPAGAAPPATREMITQLAEAYGRASDELQAVVGSGRTGVPMLSLGRQLPSGVRQQLVLLSGWLPRSP